MLTRTYVGFVFDTVQTYVETARLIFARRLLSLRTAIRVMSLIACIVYIASTYMERDDEVPTGVLSLDVKCPTFFSSRWF